MRDCAGAASALRCLVRIGLQPRDQLAEIVRRKVLPRDDQRWVARELCDRFEACLKTVREGENRAIKDMRCPGADAENVTIGRRAGGFPTSGKAMMLPPMKGSCTARGRGQSLSSERCVLAL